MVAWGQGLALQCASDCLGERLASQEAQRQADALVHSEHRWDKHLGKHPQDEAREGEDEPALTSCLCRLSCSLESERPLRGPAIKRSRGRGKEGACSSPMGKRNPNPGTCSGCTLVLSRQTGLVLAVRSTCQLLSA